VRLTTSPYQKIRYNSPMRKALLAAGLLLAGLSARAQSTATLRGLDVYRSVALTDAAAHAKFDERLHQYVSFRNAGTPGALEKAEALRRAMEKEAAAVPGVIWAELHVFEYFT
jgi:hypothetical protein